MLCFTASVYFFTHNGISSMYRNQFQASSWLKETIFLQFLFSKINFSRHWSSYFSFMRTISHITTDIGHLSIFFSPLCMCKSQTGCQVMVCQMGSNARTLSCKEGDSFIEKKEWEEHCFFFLPFFLP